MNLNQWHEGKFKKYFYPPEKEIMSIYPSLNKKLNLIFLKDYFSPLVFN
jgi:hypothetical protein